MRKSLRSMLLAGIFLEVTAAHAQSPPPSGVSDPNQKEMDTAGAEHFNLGVRFYQTGKYEAARVEFEAAYELTSHADLLHNLSLVAEKQERWADAVRYEEQFLAAPRTQDQGLSQREADEARGRIARLRENLSVRPTHIRLSPVRAWGPS